MRYYVNKNAQPNGDHEVHTSSCSFLPAEANRLYLGDFQTCSSCRRSQAALQPIERPLLLRKGLQHRLVVLPVSEDARSASCVARFSQSEQFVHLLRKR